MNACGDYTNATLTLAGAGLLALSALSPAVAQPTSTAVVRERVASYVQRFVDGLTNVVAEERYVQEFRRASDRRRLRSDFLLVKYPGEERRYQTFRDVLEVDGRPVREQQARITQLFLEPFASAVTRAAEIETASFRQSLRRGRLVDPLQAISHLQTFYQPQFEFSVAPADRRAGAGVIELNFTQIPATGSSVIPLRGKALVVEQTGRVVKTELSVGSGSNVRVTATEFGSTPAFLSMYLRKKSVDEPGALTPTFLLARSLMLLMLSVCLGETTSAKPG